MKSGDAVNAAKAILVVDDEPAILESIVEVLRDEGYAVESARNGQAALLVFEQSAPDLVLMDVMMPGLDGRAAYLAMRAHPRGQDIPVVLMSAAADPNRLAPSVTAFLPKPFDLDQLLDLVAQLLSSGSTSAVE